MPQKTQTNTYPGYDAPTLTALAYGALDSLRWNIRYGAERMIIAYTPRSWNKFDHEITIEAIDESLTMTSKHIHGEMADLPGRNKKFLAEFFAAFETTKASADEEKLAMWKEKIAKLQETTVQAVEKEVKQSVEIDKAMNLTGSNLFLTYGIIAINLIVFILMAISGVSLFEPLVIDIVKWGGNYRELTLTGDSWRLITCVFVHIGIIHLLFNMYALYMIGIYLEPMLGKLRFLSAYLATGILASLASLWWHDTPTVSAGASGAIFGMYGVFLALLTTKLVPDAIRNQLLKSIGVFVVFNLAYGMKAGIDNAAHIGGLVSGFVIGFIYYLGWKGENTSSKKTLLAGAVLALAIIVAYIYIEKNKMSLMDRPLIELPREQSIEIKFKEPIERDERDPIFVRFKRHEDKATDVFLETGLTNSEIVKKIDEVMIPELQTAKKELVEIDTEKLSETQQQLVMTLLQLCNVLLDDATLHRRRMIEGNLPEILNGLQENAQQARDLNKKLRSLQ